jgi:cleavage stimulation factor subunit 2
MIIETLGRVGQVLNFRLVYDKETGRPKGFGFAEFADADAAASAVRNLNDYEVMGRKLRVDWSNDNGAGDNAPPTTYNVSAPGMPMNGISEPAAVPQSTALPPIPPGADLPPNLTCADAISRTLNTLPPPQLLDILSQMKGLVMSDPGKATELLRQAPQLAYAIFQALLQLGLVDHTALGALIEQPAAVPPMAPPQVHAPAPQVPTPQPPRPPQNYSAYPPAPVPTPQQPPQQAPSLYAQPQQHAPPPMDPQQQAAYAQILAMTPLQIEQLPPDAKAQILQIRQMLMAGQRP